MQCINALDNANICFLFCVIPEPLVAPNGTAICLFDLAICAQPSCLSEQWHELV